MIDRRTFLAAAVLAPLVVACAPTAPGSTLERARRDGALRIGISGERPFGYTDAGGRITGAQPEVARVVLRRIGIPGMDAVQLRFDRLIPALLAGQCDLIAAGMAITPERCAQVAFSRPDFVTPPAFLVPRGNPKRLRTFDDAARTGIRLAALVGSVEVDQARAAGVPDDRLVLADDQRTLLRAVADGRADAGAMAAISLTDELRRTPGTGLEVTPPITAQTRGRTVVTAGGFAVRREDTDLLAEFDRELTALHSGAEWLRIVSQFGFGPANVPPTSLTTAALCSA
ncbi:polar amino acid transport system substrate-binding protein [Pseudonocardia thermophila]|uniref:Polar amino acid transport system substrate-binding protein n=1 Tax=Pseudonocardia thermophila TaxID=1848 RepID=A0A1M6QE91_PSETH|nr:ectoine/hydroxyectoine ABC transporter substrate-binding protein EhuB [Pseudonocardia thermophila]SHK18552.1 polar amino acid transport system substrate-binding protein [Pseudonocardia thermophila]